MDSLAATRAELALIKAFLNQAEARDKICRAIQYGSKFISAGEPGVARDVDKSTSLARKVFRLMKSVNDLEALLTPASKSTPLPIALLSKTKSSFTATFFALDQIVWAGRTGIYKNKERTELISKISLYCFLGGCSTGAILEFIELFRVARKKQSAQESSEREELEKQLERRLLLWIKSSLDIFVAIGLLQLAPKKITPRITGGLGFVTSLISCYQLLPIRKPKQI
ncbi:hypothetical protein KP509_39G032300 [Ceratopteris richardii]|uniref:Uncharacterized protein n=1 Tax=Ceratopteris richardii TaxID=49495 RepID=A0A8T2Q068_CERRI|nr:hypothetical protein KP509_39G032300 [Ceratopteris richardii]KAH7277059.1 hypothetical protein KP509_39G032300 [Ceratopteris richardii]